MKQQLLNKNGTIVTKREFLLLPKCFLKLSPVDESERVCMPETVNRIYHGQVDRVWYFEPSVSSLIPALGPHCAVHFGKAYF